MINIFKSSVSESLQVPSSATRWQAHRGAGGGVMGEQQTWLEAENLAYHLC